MSPKQFTLEEANGLIPNLTQAFDKITALKVKIGLIRESIDYAGQTGKELQEPREKLSERMNLLGEEIKRHVADIHTYGCFVKDLDHCLVDFYTIIESRPVFLCWKYGEDKVGFWHDIQQGARERQPLPSISQEIRRF